MDRYFHIPKAQHEERRLRIRLWLVAGVWTSLMAALLLWSLYSVDDEMLGLARQEAVANFNKDQAFRRWGSSHGGVYVPVTERTPASPLLAQIPERDLVTPSGRQLTLMNPAYMLRQLMEDYNELYGVKGKITSLYPLNPNNAPDAWEKSALEGFARGEKERFEQTEIDDQPFLRLIRPMVTLEGCLKCHEHEGYRVGEVGGGVGVSVPLDRYLSVAVDRKNNSGVMLSLVWVVGMTVIALGGKRGKQRIRERKDYEGRIWHQANFDGLTGLSNRNLFMDRLERAIAYARRDRHELALLFIDLDRFKDVNDTRGHAIGDRLLEEAARRVQGCVRDMDTVSRLGGDEFTVILPEIAESASATVVVNQILEALSQPFKIDIYDAHLSASIGITTCPRDGDDPGTLLQNADTAMYQAKAGGRNTYRYFRPEMNQQAEGRVTLDTAMRQALVTHAEFELLYQPIVAVRDAKPLSAEALLRWNSVTLGRVGPDKFIPVAEENGLIVPLGDWVLQQAACDLGAWERDGLNLPNLSVNVSTVQFRQHNLAEKILATVKANPTLDKKLSLEITESVFMDHYSNSEETLALLREHDIRIAIDDFGTGYSSLSYLKRFPVDIVKIDRSFVRDVTKDPEDAALCEVIIAMAQRLGLRVVAEGVENEEQLHFLRENGCDFAQGYLFGRPMTADAFAGYLRQVQKEAPIAV